MELVYSIDFHAFSKGNEFVLDEKICCSLSCRNIIAFSRARKVGADSVHREKLDITYEVCVVDLDKPWQEYEVTTSHTAINYMRWDPAGVTLLVVSTDGVFSLWRMKNYLLNSWEEFGSVEMNKEEILVLAWLHNGAQTLFNPESRDTVVYNEKFVRAKVSPSVTQFGKKAVDGWIAVTSSGMILVGLIPDQGSTLVTGKASLGHVNVHLTQADVAFMPNGHILIATSDGQVTSSIHCYLAHVALRNHMCHVAIEPSASFFLKKQSQSDNAGENQLTPRLTRLSFMNRENSEVILACWGTSLYSCVEVWHLTEQSIPLNRWFQNPAVTEYNFKAKRWMHKSSFSHRSGLTHIARPKIPISRSFNMESSNFLSFFACTYRDGSIKIVHRQSYQVLYTSNLDQLINFKSMLTPDPNTDGPPEKRSKLSSPHLLSAVQTNTGCGLVGLGEGRLYLFRVFNSRDGSLQMLPAHVVLLLEYTMFVGMDVWDVLLAVRPGMIEGIADKLHSNFQKQIGTFQELLHQRLLRVKMALYSCQGPINQRASDCRAMITLHAISSVLKACLRPKTMTEKGPAEKLYSICSISSDMDLDTISKALDPDEFMRDTISQSLQSLQPFIQWVADFVLHLLAAVSMYPSYLSYPGATLLKDPTVLVMIRELLIIIRVWGKISPACLPVFMATVDFDPLRQLFKLVTKAWLLTRDGSSVEADQDFLDECCNLPSKTLLANYRKSFGEEMNCYLAFSQPFPINYEFGVEPDFLFNPRYTHRNFPMDLFLDADQKYDCVRQVYLGNHPRERVRECVRCRSLSLLRNPQSTKSVLLRSWELRFVRSCLCGGHWKLQSRPTQ